MLHNNYSLPSGLIVANPPVAVIILIVLEFKVECAAFIVVPVVLSMFHSSTAHAIIINAELLAGTQRTHVVEVSLWFLPISPFIAPLCGTTLSFVCPCPFCLTDNLIGQF